MELKDIIKDYKYRHQLTNDEIAQKLGVTKSTVSRWISGDVKRIQDETLKRLKENQIRICLATGRTPMSLPRFDGIEFDAFLTFNGSYCFTKD